MSETRRISNYEKTHKVNTDFSYVKKQKQKKAPVFENPIHLIQSIYKEYYDDKLIEYHVHKVYEIANDTSKHYKKILIPKRNGKMREINEPDEDLKEIQRILASRFFNKFYNARKYFSANGFIKGKSIRSNAIPHLSHKYLLKLDIKDFFPSIKESLVFERCFGDDLYPESIKTLITKLVTLNSGLPQGAPTSPIISNIVMAPFDMEMMVFSSKHKYEYTRYADDISISTDVRFDKKEVINFVKEQLLKLCGMRLNKQKIVFVKDGQRKEICGVVVNKKLQVSKAYRDAIRQEMYFINKNGFQNHINYLFYEHKIKKMYSIEEYSRILLGKVNHVLNIDKDNRQFKAYKEQLEKNTGKKILPNIDRQQELLYKEKLQFYIKRHDDLVLNLDTCSKEDWAIALSSRGKRFRYRPDDFNNKEQMHIYFLGALSGSKITKSSSKDLIPVILDNESKTSKAYAYLMIYISQTFEKEYRKTAYQYWLNVGMSLGLAKAYYLASLDTKDKDESKKLLKIAADLKDGEAQYKYALKFCKKDSEEYYSYILAAAENDYSDAYLLAGDYYNQLGLSYFAYNYYSKCFDRIKYIDDVDDELLIKYFESAKKIKDKSTVRELLNELHYRGINIL